jgi:hypothetical protein
MKTFVVSTLASVVLLALPLVASAKGQIVRLIVHGADLSAALEIIDSEVVGSFDIWQGPGVQVNGKSVHLNRDDPGPAFIDWFNGASTERPTGLLRYEVTFVIDGRARGEYVILYEFDPSVAGGYVYLPGRGDAHASENVGLIYHGVEGNWFHSSARWERLVRPLVEQAARASWQRAAGEPGH